MRVFTEEWKQKISDACKGRVPRNKGIKWSDEIKEKISNGNKGKTLGRKRPEHSRLLKERGFAPMKGKKHSKETLEKLSISHKGIIQSYEWRKKRGESMMGEKNCNRNGGPKTTKEEKRKIRNGFEYREWRKEVFERDKYTCRDCNIKGLYIEAHHIKSFTEYPELRYDVDNGLTLCKKCHNKYTFIPKTKNADRKNDK